MRARACRVPRPTLAPAGTIPSAGTVAPMPPPLCASARQEAASPATAHRAFVIGIGHEHAVTGFPAYVGVNAASIRSFVRRADNRRRAETITADCDDGAPGIVEA